ncbi:EpsG family protein [Schleiferiaceae bacterium]|nr:EpsG family protein [Schleiferiaceae bacterium]
MLVLSVAFLGSLFSALEKKTSYVITLIFIFIISVFRYGVGTDYAFYYTIASENRWNIYTDKFFISQYKNDYDLYYILADSLVKYGCPAWLGPSFLTVVGLLLLFVGNKTGGRGIYLLPLWILNPFGWLMSMSISSQFAALGSVFFALYLFEKKLYKKGIIWSIIAAYFHLSSFLVLLIYLAFKHMSIKKIYVVIIILIAVYMAYVHYNTSELISYLSYVTEKKGIGGNILLAFNLIYLLVVTALFAGRNRASMFALLLPFLFLLNQGHLGSRLFFYLFPYILYQTTYFRRAELVRILNLTFFSLQFMYYLYLDYHRIERFYLDYSFVWEL